MSYKDISGFYANYVCSECGAVVFNPNTHSEWHTQVRMKEPAPYPQCNITWQEMETAVVQQCSGELGHNGPHSRWDT